VPELTEERRKQLVKVVRQTSAEEGPRRDPQRPARRDARPCREPQGGRRRPGSDDEHRADEVELQKVTDTRIKELDELLQHKEEEILEV